MNLLPSGPLQSVLRKLPEQYPGPGGAVAVLRAGQVLEAHTWGWADVDRRLPFTAQTMALICSITKQFTCGLLLDQFKDPTVLEDDLGRALPGLMRPPGILDLCHNQSGLRDYWALAMLSGAAVEGAFGPADATRLIGGAQSLQFQPGTRYSYANQNFRLLAELIQQRLGRPFQELLRTRIFERAAMPTAVLNPDTSAVTGGAVGYEGSVALGYRAAVNRIHWTGDAGIAASLEDLIAWEQFIDAGRDDVDGLYRRLSSPQFFRNGATAFYGFGLGHINFLGRAATCHGGGLRGWRSFRVYVPVERVSVVVLFNHMADPRAAALDLLSALLGTSGSPTPRETASPSERDGRWAGRYLDSETGLAAQIQVTSDGRSHFHYASSPEPMNTHVQHELHGSQTRLFRESGQLWMVRVRENQKSTLLPCGPTVAYDIEGDFHCPELSATLSCSAQGGVLYGAFSGALGEGSMQMLQPYGTDIWILPCPRALDYEPPGDWTLHFTRNAQGAVEKVRIGCWLARNLEFVRT